MIDDHGSPADFDPACPASSRSTRFARLVRSPVVRRFSSRRLAVATFAGVGLIWGGVWLTAWCRHAVGGWVAAQSEHQIPFTAIALEPPPPAFIPGGSAGILDAVRHGARYDTTISVLAADLAALKTDLSLNPWIESVHRVRRSYRHLAAEVTYRQPLALIVYENVREEAAVIDRQGVELPVQSNQVELVADPPRYRMVGSSDTLIKIHQFGMGLPNRVGLTWKPLDTTISDSMVVQAVRLAAFLHDSISRRASQGLSAPNFEIYYHEEPNAIRAGRPHPIHGFYLLGSDQRYIYWGAGPGAEKDEEPTAAEKWATLMRFLATHRSLKTQLTPNQFLSVQTPKPEIVQARNQQSRHTP